MSSVEKTLSIIKPDAVERNLSETIKSIFTKNNLLILDSKNCLVLREKINFEFPIRLLQGTADNDVPLDLALRLINHIDCNDAKLEIFSQTGPG